VEYEALGEDFSTRGARIEEQIEVMRLLWSREVVSYEGKYHRIDEAGINPLPVQRPIPVWMGARADVGLRRTARPHGSRIWRLATGLATRIRHRAPGGVGVALHLQGSAPRTGRGVEQA
jgi:alkanesulfonate monooxygenase SsuD/methylene tetrahydromethanopterin reductase-like flavin-dependent oxidoreductase (luciferase family)